MGRQLRRARVAVAALALVLRVGALAGQSATTWFAGGGLSLPAGDFSVYANTGWGVVGGLEHRLGTHLTALRVDLSYATNGDTTALGFHETTHLLSALASLVYHFDGAHPHLYALVGAGYFSRRFSSDDPEDIPIDDGHFAIQLGEGLIFRVRSATIFAEGRFVTSLGPGPFRYFPVVVGVRLGGH